MSELDEGFRTLSPQESPQNAKQGLPVTRKPFSHLEAPPGFEPGIKDLQLSREYFMRLQTA